MFLYTYNYYVCNRSIKKEIVEWFRIALQWDPKKRGKLPNSNEVTLFNMWKKISTKQVYLVN